MDQGSVCYEHSYVYVSNKESVVSCVSKNVNATTEAGAGEDGTRGETSGRRREVAIEEEMEATGDHGTRKR